MNRDRVREVFVDLIRPYVRVKNMDAITEESLLVDDLKVNSTRFVDIILEAEDKFKIHVADEEMERFEQVGSAIDFICEKSLGG